MYSNRTKNDRKYLLTFIVLATLAGVATGFMVPLAVSHEPPLSFGYATEKAEVSGTEISAVGGSVAHRASRVKKRRARKRHLMAGSPTYKSQQATDGDDPRRPVESRGELRSQAVFGQ